MRGTRKNGADPDFHKPHLSVLIVDDDSFLADTFQTILEDAGFHVETAATGAEALAKAGTTPFKLVITDLSLPDIKGVELSNMLKEKISGVAVVLICGMSNVEITVFSDRLDKVQTKPVDSLKLLRVSNSFKTHL